MFTNKNKLIGIIALVVVIVLVFSAAIALIADSKIKSDAAEADKKIAALEAELKVAQDKLNNTVATKAQLQEEVNKLTTAKTALEKEITSLKSSISALESNVAANKDTIASYKTQLDALNAALNTLNSALDSANQKIDELESLLDAMTGDWDAVTPMVYGKLLEVTNAYNAALAMETLVDGFDADALYDAYTTAWTAIIRARNEEQLNVAVNDFNDYIKENITEKSYTYLFAQLVDAIPGVVYGGEEDDAARIEAAYTYYNNAILGNVDAEAACAELKARLDGYADEYATLRYNSYRDAYLAALNNLPALFHAEDNAAEVQAVVDTWTALVTEYPAEQKEAKHLAMENRLEKIETIILPMLDEMEALVGTLKFNGDKLAITEENYNIVKGLVALHNAFSAIVTVDDPYYTDMGIAGFDAELTEGVATLWEIYNAFLAASAPAKLGLGVEMTLSARESAIADAETLAAKLTEEDLALIALYHANGDTALIKGNYDAGVANIAAAKVVVEEIKTLVIDIKAEIDRLIKVEDLRDPAEYAHGVRGQHLVTLEGLVAQLTAYVGADNVNDSIGEEYVAKLAEVRLYPAQNEAYDVVNAYYNTLFEVANKDGKAELTVCKGQLFGLIANAKTQADIDVVLNTYAAELDACVR